jgi:hypothetical protein
MTKKTKTTTKKTSDKVETGTASAVMQAPYDKPCRTSAEGQFWMTGKIPVHNDENDKFYAVCYTLNNYTDEELDLLRQIPSTYHICTEEEGKLLTVHIQGYVEFGTQFRFNRVKKYLGNAAHFEKRFGTPKQAAGYCLKGEDENRKGQTPGNDYYFDYPGTNVKKLIECGKISRQGYRFDLEDKAQELYQGKTTCDELCITMPELFHQYSRTFNRIEDIAFRKKFRTWMAKVYWFWGSTGVGKSETLFGKNCCFYNPETHYLWKYDGDWQDGYTGQPVVIINEFRGEIKYSTLLELCDRWPTTVRRRGREPAPFLAKKILISSCKKPEDVYSGVCNREDSINQLLRRITEVIEIKDLAQAGLLQMTDRSGKWAS